MRRSYVTRARWIAAWALMATTIACADGAPTGARAPASAEERQAHATASAATLARGLALAMRRETTRAAVLAAMRASPYTRHALSLQQFAQTREGTLALREGSRALGLRDRDLANLVRDAAPLELSVPARADRMTWRGTSNLAVSARVARGSDRSPAYTVDGAMLTDPDRPGASYVAIDVRPAGIWILRVTPQANRPGPVIQDVEDGEIGVALVEHRAFGDSTVTQLSPRIRISRVDGTSSRGTKRGGGAPGMLVVSLDGCVEEFQLCDGSGGGSPPTVNPDTLFLGRIATIQVCDFTDCGASNELRFETKVRSASNGAVIGSAHTLAIDGWGSSEEGYVDLPLHFAKPTATSVGAGASGTYAQVHVYEDDGDWGRDEFGTIQALSSDNAHSPAYYPTGSSNYFFSVGDSRCHIAGYSCPIPTPKPNGWLYYAEVVFNLWWR